jgi:hypothetical protein
MIINQKLPLKKLLLLCFLPFVFLLAGCFTTAPHWGNVRGTIVDTSGNAISGATAQVDSDVAETASDGNYALSRVTAGTKTVILSKTGYTTSYRRVELGLGETTYANLAILAPLDSKVAVVGSSGGRVSNTSGSVQLNIPAGALSADTQIQLSEVPLAAAPYPPPVGYQFIAVIVYITPYATTPSQNVTLSIPNITGLADGTEVPFYVFNLASLEWQSISSASGEAHSSSGTITAYIRNFGWIAAIIPIAPAAGTISGTISDSSTGNGIPYANVWSSYFSTVTDSRGEYILSNMPTGEATVEAVAPGYARNSQKITVVGGATATCNLALSALTTGSVEGYVYRSSNLAAVSGARVVASTGVETTTDQHGSYSLCNVDAGTITIYAYANGYVHNSTTEVVHAGETVTANIYLTKTGEATAWTDDFETDRTWEVSSAFPEVIWQRVSNEQFIRDNLSPQYVALPDYGSTLGRLPQAHSGSYAYWYGQRQGEVATGCYVAVQKVDDATYSGGTSSTSYPYNYGYLVSPLINLSNFASATLSFWTWWEVEGVNAATGYDQMKVQISTDGGTSYTTLAVLNPYSDPDISKEAYRPYSSGGYNQAGAWVQHSFDLTSYVGQSIKIRFYFNTVDILYNGFRGWLIDDFSVTPEAVAASAVSRSAVNLRPDRGEIKIKKRGGNI